MEYDEFVKRVQETAEWDSREEVLRAVAATLGTIGELLSKTEREDLAAQLHKPLKQYLFAWTEHLKGLGRPRRFSLEEFYNRVAARSGVRYPAAVRHSQAVLKVLKQAVSPGELADVFRELPDEYGELLTGQPRGPLSPSIVQQRQ